MKEHISFLVPRRTCVPDTPPEIVQILGIPGRFTTATARQHLSTLVRLAGDRIAPDFVARELRRSRSTIYSWNHPQCVSLKAHELLLAPRPWSLTVTRGLLAQIEGRSCGSPSRMELMRLLARAAELVASARSEDLTSLPTELLRSQVDAMRSTKSELDDALRAREAELFRRASNAPVSSTSTTKKGAC